MDSFLAIAEELKLKGLAGQSSGNLLEEQEKPANPKLVEKNKELSMKTTVHRDAVSNDKVPTVKAEENISRSLDITNKFSEHWTKG